MPTHSMAVSEAAVPVRRAGKEICGLPWWQMMEKKNAKSAENIFADLIRVSWRNRFYRRPGRATLPTVGMYWTAYRAGGRHLAATLHVPPRQVYREGWQDRGDSHSYSWTFSAAIFQ